MISAITYLQFCQERLRRLQETFDACQPELDKWTLLDTTADLVNLSFFPARDFDNRDQPVADSALAIAQRLGGSWVRINDRLTGWITVLDSRDTSITFHYLPDAGVAVINYA